MRQPYYSEINRSNQKPKGRQQGKMYHSQIHGNNSSENPFGTLNHFKYKILNWILSTLLFACIYNVTIADWPLSIKKWEYIVGFMLLTSIVANVFSRWIYKIKLSKPQPHNIKVGFYSTFYYSLVLLFGWVTFIFREFPVFATGLDYSLILNVVGLLLITKIVIWAISQLTVFFMEKWLNQ